MRGLTALTGAVTGTHCMDEKVLWTCHRTENQVFMKSIQMEHLSIKEWSLPKANQISNPELQHQRCLRRRTQQIPSTTIQDNSGTEDEWTEKGMSFYSRGEFFSCAISGRSSCKAGRRNSNWKRSPTGKKKPRSKGSNLGPWTKPLEDTQIRELRLR